MEVTEILELLREEGDVVLVEGQSLQMVQLTQLRGDCVQAVAIEIEFLEVRELVGREQRRKVREERMIGGEWRAREGERIRDKVEEWRGKRKQRMVRSDR